MIPYGRQSINPDDIAAVQAVLESDWLTQGPAVPRFEQDVAAYCGASEGVAASSGTAALHLACLALGVGPGDVVWTTPNTFVASANCARYCAADVDFVDIDASTLNLCPRKLAQRLSDARRAGGRLPKVVIPVHFAGRPCDMAAIADLGREFDFRIIEDASHALGGVYEDGNRVGSAHHADLVVASFHPVKLITTGEGGMLLTRNGELAAHLRRLRSHGITRDPAEMDVPSEGPWYYQQVELGFNYRMTDLQGALGSSQMRRLPEFLRRRRELVQRYRRLLADLPVGLPAGDADMRSGWHLFVVRVAASARRQIFESMRQSGIGVNVHYLPVHLQPDYRRLGFRRGDFPEAEAYYGEAITLPLHPGLTDDEQDAVVAALRAALLGDKS
jgi:UDP-4-amino-4,6-dideoxy-N-acetyl-beta-L-altrosamine transaminase